MSIRIVFFSNFAQYLSNKSNDMKALSIFLTLFFVLVINSQAQKFDDYFIDKTLRIDYTFSGDVHAQHIFLDQLNMMPHWYGKRSHLSEVPMEGNGQIIVKEHNSEHVIYKNSFSTLFQEWLSNDEAKIVQRSFENVYLVPMPKDTVDVTVNLYNNRREIMATMTHTIVPTDILIHQIGEQTTPFEVVQQAKDENHCIHIAFVAEAYTESEMNIFMEDVRVAVEALFAHEPFKSNRDKFNIIAVKSVSQESGPSIPGKGIWKNTVLHSHFNTFYSDRYLTTLALKDLHNVLAGTPYEHIIVLVNTNNYGGGGILNSYNLSMTHHSMYKPVVVHEFGHSFAGLADEYAYEFEAIPMYPKDVEPWEKNITTLHQFKGKWEKQIKSSTPKPTPATAEYKDKIGLFEGAGYSMKGVYRPTQDCRMRTNTKPDFCPICRQAIQEVIDFYTK